MYKWGCENWYIVIICHLRKLWKVKFFILCEVKVVLHWSTCNANLQRRFATHVFRTNLQTCYTFESLSKTFKALQHCKYRKKSSATGCYTRMICFAQHRIIASWRCKLTTVTPPLYFWWDCRRWGEIWNWSLLGVKGFKMSIEKDKGFNYWNVY